MIVDSMKVPVGQIGFVGDRLYTDIATGVNHGGKGFLVLTGETVPEDLETSAVKPDAEALELVRCKDCRNLEITGCYGECRKGYLGIVRPDDFCSRAEKRGGVR